MKDTTSPVVKEVALAPIDPPVTDVVGQIVAMAANADMDVAKLEKLIEMQERVVRHQAESAFNQAFAVMQVAGQALEVHVPHASGTAANPMTDEAMRRKFLANAAGLASAEAMETALEIMPSDGGGFYDLRLHRVWLGLVAVLLPVLL